jgi:hypothetical protein
MSDQCYIRDTYLAERYDLVTGNEFSPYDYVAKDGTHYLELKDRRISSTKYADAIIDNGKMVQLLALDKPTALLTTYTNGKVYIGLITARHSKTKEIVVARNCQVIKRCAEKTTNFSNRQVVEKTFYSLKLETLKELN